MPVTVYRPRLQVLLKKLVARAGDGVAERARRGPAEIDLTPMLGDGSGIKVSKGVREPYGSFSLSVPDQADPTTLDTLHALIEPMDVIEIRAAREPHNLAGGPLPLLMRGFVSSVRRIESMNGDNPQRSVVVMGHDAGKLWHIHQVFPQSLYMGVDNPYIDRFLFQATSGISAGWLPVSDFLQQLTERVVNKRLEEMAAYTQRHVSAFAAECTVREGYVSPGVIGAFSGAYWGLVDMVSDAPWNEAFIEDRDLPVERPVLVFRPAPFKDIGGALIGGAADPGTMEVSIADVVSIDVARTDQRVANFFWVPPNGSDLDHSRFATVAAIGAGQPFDAEYGNNKPELYGLRKMEAGSFLAPGESGGPLSSLTDDQLGTASQAFRRWHERRGDLLKAMNRDNSVLEDGQAVVRGREDLKPGRYVRFARGGLTWEAYVPQVQHQLQPFGTWTTTLSFERGTGFLERLKLAGSPYRAEGGRGPYSR